MKGRSGHRTALLLLLFLALALRLALVARGGQRYFPDENRYLRCFILMRHLGRGETAAAVDYVLDNADHTGFILVGLVPALVHRGLLGAVGLPVTRESLDETLWIPAALLSVSSVVCIALVHAIARRAGGDEPEALAAAFLMAGSASMFYFARHLLPYDASMALALGALWVGLHPHAGLGRSLAVGGLAGAALLTYNGYWLSALAVVGLHAAWGGPRAGDMLRRAAAAVAGLAALPLTLTLTSMGRGLGPYVRKMWRFSRGASTQTDFHEGWSLPWAYLWHAEHGLLLALLIGAVAVLWLSRGSSPAAARGLWWMGTAAAMYVAFVVLSNGFERIGTFGRLARQLVPLLSLTAGSAAAALASSPARRKALLAVAALIAIQAAFNFAPPLRMRFPREVDREVTAVYGEISHDTTVVLGRSDERTVVPGSRYVLLNARYLYPIRGLKAPPPGRTLFTVAHPVQFLPYQYEGYVPEERALLRAHEVSMQIIDTAVVLPSARVRRDPREDDPR
jgi:hypothetical protein